jgi:branched-chain amino acid transport system ATP-binding protein
MTTIAAVLEIEALHAGHSGLTVVRDVDLSVHAGEVVALLGPNGAGKTTLLETVAGLLPTVAGRISVMGAPPNVRRPHLAARRGLAYVPDNRSLFRNLTAHQNLALAAHRAKAQVSSVYQYLPELRPLASRQAGLLSGGEQQMLAIGRALLMTPRVLMIDELSMGLAPLVVERLLHLVRSVADDLGIGVLLVEQHVRMALGVADSAYVISHGTLTTHGSADEVRAQAGAIEASYLGEAAPL